MLTAYKLLKSKNIAPNIPAAITHLYAEDEDTISYLKDLDNMHKVVLEVSV